MKTVNIESLQNPKIKLAVKLRDKRQRDQTGQFLIEGYREIFRAIEANHPIQTLFICPEFFLGSNERALIDTILKQGAQVLACSMRIFEKVSYRDRPDGLLAIAPKQPKDLNQLEKRNPNPLFIVAEAIEKPGNLGTILRSADAVAADGVIVCDRCTDIYNPNVVRASVGTRFTVPVIEAGGQETLEFLRKNKIAIVAATPHADHLYTEVDLKGPIAIAVGTEQLGLSERWLKEADLQVKIPMYGTADSLNVATATTLLLYEAMRQRVF